MVDPKSLKKWAIDYINQNRRYIIIVSVVYFVLFFFFFFVFLFNSQPVGGEGDILEGVMGRSILMDRADIGYLFNKGWDFLLTLFLIVVLGFVFSVGALLYVYLDVSPFALALSRFIQYENMDGITTLLVHQIFTLPIKLLVFALSLKLTIRVYQTFLKQSFGKVIKNLAYVIFFSFLLLLFLQISNFLPGVIFDILFVLMLLYLSYFVGKRVWANTELKELFRFFFIIIVPLFIVSYVMEIIFLKFVI